MDFLSLVFSYPHRLDLVYQHVCILLYFRHAKTSLGAPTFAIFIIILIQVFRLLFISIIGILVPFIKDRYCGIVVVIALIRDTLFYLSICRFRNGLSLKNDREEKSENISISNVFTYFISNSRCNADWVEEAYPSDSV